MRRPLEGWFRFPGLAYLLIGLVVSVFQVVRMISSTRLGYAAFAQDDAYYYFRIAQNIALGRGSTWDGIHSTNGYHPLWLLLLVPLYFVFRGRAAGMVVPKVLAGVLWVFDAVQLRAIARVVGAESTFWIGLLPGALIVTYEVRSPPFNGVETPILLATLLFAARALLQTDLLAGRVPETRAQWRGTWVAGIALALVVLSRLDAVSIAGLFGVWVLVRLLWARQRASAVVRTGAVLAAPTVIALAVYLVVNRALFDTWLPVSGQVKALPPPTGGWPDLHAYFTTGLGIPLPIGPGLFALGIVVVVGLSFLLTGADRSGTRSRRLELFALVNLAYLGGLLLVGYYDRTTSWKLLSWYYYGSTFVLVAGPGIAVANVATWWTERRSAVEIPWARSRRLGFVAAGAAVVLAAGAGYSLRLAPGGDEDFFVQSAVIAKKLNRTLPRGAVVAMADRAGVFGYELDRPVVSIEGIVNDTDYLHAVEQHRVPLSLRRDGVDYYVRSINAEEERNTTPRRDLGGIAPGTCGLRAEPLYGIGRKTWFRVCANDLVFATPRDAVESLAVWKVTRR